MAIVSSTFTLRRYKYRIRRIDVALALDASRLRRMLKRGQGLGFVKRFEGFTQVERALTLAGLGPAMLLGCAVHTDAMLAASLPVPSYRVLMPFPAAAKPNVPFSLLCDSAAMTTLADSAIRGFSQEIRHIVHITCTTISRSHRRCCLSR